MIILFSEYSILGTRLDFTRHKGTRLNGDGLETIRPCYLQKAGSTACGTIGLFIGRAKVQDQDAGKATS